MSDELEGLIDTAYKILDVHGQHLSTHDTNLEQLSHGIEMNDQTLDVLLTGSEKHSEAIQALAERVQTLEQALQTALETIGHVNQSIDLLGQQIDVLSQR